MASNGMRNISSLIERFTKSLNKGRDRQELVSQVIEEKTGARIPTENIFIKEGLIEISTSPAVKNEISLKLESIRTELKVRGLQFGRIIYK